MIDKLKELGLTEYEAKVYITLLKEGTLKGTQVHRKSGVPHSPTYHSLLSLESKGFITITPTKPKKFSAINPKLAINNFISRKVEHIKEIEHEISDGLLELKKPQSADEMIEKVNITAGSDRIFSIIKYLFDEAKDEMRVMYTYEIRNYLQQKGTLDAIKRGVKVRILATKKLPLGIKWMKEDVRLGAEVRYFRVEELRIVVQDNKKSVISMINPRDSRDRVITYFEHGLFSNILAKYFDEIWKKAQKIS